MIEGFDLENRFVLADKGYDSQKPVSEIEGRSGIAMIPSRKPRPLDKWIYRGRHLVESFFQRIKVS